LRRLPLGAEEKDLLSRPGQKISKLHSNKELKERKEMETMTKTFHQEPAISTQIISLSLKASRPGSAIFTNDREGLKRSLGRGMFWNEGINKSCTSSQQSVKNFGYLKRLGNTSREGESRGGRPPKSDVSRVNKK